MNYKKHFISLFLGSLPIIGLWPATTIVAGQTTLHNPPFINATSFLPQINLDFSDLDVRDDHNQPVKSVDAQQNFKMLFLDNLFILAVLDTPHELREAWTMLESISHLFHDAILISRRVLYDTLDAFLKPSFKRFVHNVNNLWITISVGVLLTLLLSAKDPLQRVPQSLILRC
jgi:hypothetical protein